MDQKDKALEYLRGLERLNNSPIKSTGYTSDLDQDTTLVKGKPVAPDNVTRIRNATDKIDTKGIAKIGNAADVMKANADKISRMKALKSIGGKIPMLGALTAGVGTMMGSENASASDGLRAAAEELPGDLPIVGQAFDAIKPEDSGPQMGSFDDRLEKGQLTPEELEMLKQQYMSR